MVSGKREQAKMKHIPFMSGFFRNYRLTAVTGTIGSLYLFLAVYYRIDLFEYLIEVFHQFQKAAEPYEGDEVVPVLVLVGMGFVGDMLRQRRQAHHDQELSNQRMQSMQSTMAEVHDVVNNFLNNMQLFRFEAERSGALSEEYLREFDDLIAETAQNLKAIENLNDAENYSTRTSDPKNRR